MIDELVKSHKNFEEVLTKVAQINGTPEGKEFLSAQLKDHLEIRTKADAEVIKYSTRVMITFLIYLLLLSSNVDQFSVTLVTVKDLSTVIIFFPVLIAYYALLVASADLKRVNSIFLHHILQSILHPSIVQLKVEDAFIPFSYINVFSKSPSSSKFIRFQTNLLYRLVFGCITFAGFIAFVVFIKLYPVEKINNNLSISASMMLQISILLLTLSVFIRKLSLHSGLK